LHGAGKIIAIQAKAAAKHRQNAGNEIAEAKNDYA